MGSSADIGARWIPMLKHPNNQETESTEAPASRLKVMVPCKNGQFDGELFGTDGKLLPDEQQIPSETIQKGSYIATLLECGGIWFTEQKFGITWRLAQAVVHRRESGKGQLEIPLTPNDIKLIDNNQPGEDAELDATMTQSGAGEDSASKSATKVKNKKGKEEEQDDLEAVPIKKQKKKVVKKKKPI